MRGGNSAAWVQFPASARSLDIDLRQVSFTIALMIFIYTTGVVLTEAKKDLRGIEKVTSKKHDGEPKGIVIALVVNMQSIGLTKTAEKLVRILKDQ